MEESNTPYQITTGVWMVPCAIDKSKKIFVPVTKPFKNGKKLNEKEKRHT